MNFCNSKFSSFSKENRENKTIFLLQTYLFINVVYTNINYRVLINSSSFFSLFHDAFELLLFGAQGIAYVCLFFINLETVQSAKTLSVCISFFYNTIISLPF